ncbi:hypothetical protein ACIP93_32630 [Streptomyces sp. NPDC088745]|uniref:hypothetical protein n=1 Tax=Streptomyces sp. NPDC088745 TaxID=3365884 RepID=UPI00380712DD
MTTWWKWIAAALVYGIVMGVGRGFLKDWDCGWDAVAYGGTAAGAYLAVAALLEWWRRRRTAVQIPTDDQPTPPRH